MSDKIEWVGLRSGREKLELVSCKNCRFSGQVPEGEICPNHRWESACFEPKNLKEITKMNIQEKDCRRCEKVCW